MNVLPKIEVQGYTSLFYLYLAAVIVSATARRCETTESSIRKAASTREGDRLHVPVSCEQIIICKSLTRRNVQLQKFGLVMTVFFFKKSSMVDLQGLSAVMSDYSDPSVTCLLLQCHSRVYTVFVYCVEFQWDRINLFYCPYLWLQTSRV